MCKHACECDINYRSRWTLGLEVLFLSMVILLAMGLVGYTVLNVI